ncbi:MAG: thioredoxin family protein [Gemmatimonadaceae bacterium]
MTFSLTPERYQGAADYHGYVAAATKNVELWNGLYRTLPLPQRFVDRARAVPGRWHLLVLSEDWCGDAVNTIPLIARLVEEVPSLDLRILARDQNLDVMAEHLTNGTKSIPVVMVLDEHFVERGRWGPRPTQLQSWVISEGMELPKDDRYRKTRQWYARDRGETTLEEVVSLLERAARPGKTGDDSASGPERTVGGSPGH